MKKTIICILGAVLILLAVGVGVFVYHTRYETVLIDESLSPNGEYTLTLFSVGEPDWPFGSAHGSITLTKNGKKLSKTEIDLAQDGCQISKENWSVVWNKSYAQVTLYADEQEDEHWQIYFDGRTVQVPNAPVENKTVLSDIKATENENGETVFLVSAKDFIEGFNNIFEKRNGHRYLETINAWTQLSDKTPFYEYDAVCHRFSADKQDWQMPAMSIYTSENEHSIYEIKLTFNDHGYQEGMYREFREMCLCALSAVLPELSDDEIDVLYSELYEQTDKNFWGDYFPDSDGERPGIEVMYRSGSVGLYGYYGAGTANICIVPLCENATEFLNEQGIDSQSVR